MNVMSGLTAVSSDTSEQGGTTKVENAAAVGEWAGVLIDLSPVGCLTELSSDMVD